MRYLLILIAASLHAQTCPSVQGVTPPTAITGNPCITFACPTLSATSQWTFQMSVDYACLAAAITPYLTQTPPVPPTAAISGRYVRIQLAAQGYLSLAEVQVMSPAGVDIALKQSATQSSTYPTTSGITPSAGLAVDGNADGDFFDGSVTHTSGNEAGWWQTDLGSVQPIGSIVIWNRTDCCPTRLQNYTVTISNNADGSSPVWTSVQTTAPSPSVTIQVP